LVIGSSPMRVIDQPLQEGRLFSVAAQSGMQNLRAAAKILLGAGAQPQHTLCGSSKSSTKRGGAFTYFSLSAALARSSALEWLYRAVVSSRLCPRKVAAVTRSTSGSRTSCVATVWRKVCGVTPSTAALFV
jgi:hypothetical protein